MTRRGKIFSLRNKQDEKEFVCGSWKVKRNLHLQLDCCRENKVSKSKNIVGGTRDKREVFYFFCHISAEVRVIHQHLCFHLALLMRANFEQNGCKM